MNTVLPVTKQAAQYIIQHRKTFLGFCRTCTDSTNAQSRIRASELRVYKYYVYGSFCSQRGLAQLQVLQSWYVAGSLDSFSC